MIIAGVNDVYQGRPADHVTGQLRRMYDLAAHAGIRIVAGTIVPYNTATADQNDRMHRINAWIGQQVTADPAVAFVDTRAAVAAPGDPDRLVDSPDGLHPSARGYRQMAEVIGPVLGRRFARYPVRNRRRTCPEPVSRIRAKTMFPATRLSPARAFAVGACALTVLAVPTSAQIKVSTQTVPLYVTVTDAEKRLVPDLVREDFEIYDNGKLQTLTNFDNKATPISVVVMLDTSGSMTLALDLVKQAAEEFLIRLLPEDKAKVGAFNDKIEVKPQTGLPFTNNRDQLIRYSAGSRLRLSDPPLRRRRLQHQRAEGSRRQKSRAGVHRRRGHGEPRWAPAT